jgi:hypothetical protein
MDQAELAEKMLARADKDNLPEDHELRVKGKAFAEACKGYLGSPQTINVAQFMGAWARARKCWCAYTGESLL